MLFRSDRRLAALGAELEREAEAAEEVHGAVCRCVARLAATLKPEYAEALRRIDLDGVCAGFAHVSGISVRKGVLSGLARA